MDKKDRNWITLREFEICYPLEYLEFLETFGHNNMTCVLLDENSIKKIDLLIKKDEELKTQKFINRIEQPQQTKKNQYDFNQFLNEVRTGNLSNIEIENYIYKLSKKHNSEKLKTILKDIDFYLFVEKEDCTDRDRLEEIGKNLRRFSGSCNWPITFARFSQVRV